MKTARNLDVAIIVRGDGDFAPAIRAVQEMGVRVEVISFRGNTSSDLIDVADIFTDITQLAKVDGIRAVGPPRRRGRRGPVDDRGPGQDDRGHRARPRPRSRPGGRYERDEAPVAARARPRPERGPDDLDAAGRPRRGLVALPGEKLSRAAASASDIEEPEELEELVEGAGAAEGEGEGDARRRRRRRGGRGRGRGRRDEVGTAMVSRAPRASRATARGRPGRRGHRGGDRRRCRGGREAGSRPPRRRPAGARPVRPHGVGDFATPFDDLEALAAPRKPRSTPFGSVWDQQLGAPARPAASGPAPVPEDDEDLDEPEIPEYLLAERRNQGNRGGGGGGGGRGRNAAYAAAIDRERYGGGRAAARARDQSLRRVRPAVP